MTTPANNATTDKYFYVGGRSDTPAVQNGNNSTSHLVERYAPLWGKVANVPSNEKPSMIMQHLASVVKVKVTNTTEKPLTVNSVAFTSTEPIVGQFYIDVTGAAVEYTTAKGLFNSSTASLTVNGATPLANGESAVYYIPIKPHTVASGEILKISVNGYEKPLTLPKDVTFTAGKIKTLAFNYNKVVVDYVTVPWTEDFSGDLSLYTLVSKTSTTKTYNETLANGTAPELLISKNGGSFSAKVKAEAGNYLLTFKTNKPDILTVLSSDANVTVVKESATEYLLTVPEGGSTFSLTIKNTHEKDNARIDDISLVADTAVRVPVITVDNSNISVKPEGDIVTLKYSIKYPAAGATIKASSADAWVNTFDYTKAGEITFAVDANVDEARTAIVTLSYPGAAPVAVTVSQRAAGSAAEPKSFEWDLSSKSDAWLSYGCEAYFSQPYGIKKVNAYIINKSIADFENASKISISVKSLCNNATTSKLTVYLVDTKGNVIGEGKVITPDNQSQAKNTTYKEVVFDSVSSQATGIMVKCTTFGKNVLINGVKYTVTY